MKFVDFLPCTLPFVTGIKVTKYICDFMCADTESETNVVDHEIMMIMRLTKEFKYDYNLDTDSLQEVIAYNTME